MKNSQREFWNKVLDTQNLKEQSGLSSLELDSEINFYMTPEQIFAYKEMGDLNGKRVLEIGAGIGINAIIMARSGAEVFVMDIAEERLKVLKKIVSDHSLDDKIHVIQMQAENLAFPDEYFDVVYTKSVLIHTDLKIASHEIKRVLKDDGIGVFIEPFADNPFVNFYRKTFAPKYWQEITKYFNEERVLILTSPFSNIEIRKFYLISFFAFIWQFGIRNNFLFNIFLRILQPIDQCFFKNFPKLRKYAWFGVICLRK